MIASRGKQMPEQYKRY
ncbi:MAG: hypothetical protein AAGK01_08525, partial [Pseudomonadota bacterium]